MNYKMQDSCTQRHRYAVPSMVQVFVFLFVFLLLFFVLFLSAGSDKNHAGDST